VERPLAKASFEFVYFRAEPLMATWIILRLQTYQSCRGFNSVRVSEKRPIFVKLMATSRCSAISHESTFG
jgi:hypothetical protein